MTNALPAEALFDTPLLLAFRAGDDAAYFFTDNWVTERGLVPMSASSVLAILAECDDADDRVRQVKFVKNSKVVSLTAEVAKRAERLLRSLPLPTTLTADDALVAATALIHKLPLYSLDPDRYAAVAGLTSLPAR
jgi:predicted nucleic acid-binding protein